MVAAAACVTASACASGPPIRNIAVGAFASESQPELAAAMREIASNALVRTGQIRTPVRGDPLWLPLGHTPLRDETGLRDPAVASLDAARDAGYQAVLRGTIGQDQRLRLQLVAIGDAAEVLASSEQPATAPAVVAAIEELAGELQTRPVDLSAVIVGLDSTDGIEAAGPLRLLGELVQRVDHRGPLSDAARQKLLEMPATMRAYSASTSPLLWAMFGLASNDAQGLWVKALVHDSLNPTALVGTGREHCDYDTLLTTYPKIDYYRDAAASCLIDRVTDGLPGRVDPAVAAADLERAIAIGPRPAIKVDALKLRAAVARQNHQPDDAADASRRLLATLETMADVPADDITIAHEALRGARPKTKRATRARAGLPLAAMSIDDVIEGTAAIDEVDCRGWTTLHYAAERGDLRATAHLLRAGADPNVRTARDETPLHRAAYRGRLRVVNALLKAGAHASSRDNNGRSPLSAALWGGHRDTVQALLSGGAAARARDDAARGLLHDAVRFDRTGSIELLIDAGSDPNAHNVQGQGPLYLAATLDRARAAASLIAGGALVDRAADHARPWLAAWEAARHGHSATLAVLLKAGAAVNTPDGEDSPLHAAALTDSRATIRLLVGAGANVDARDSSQLAPLHLAAQRGGLEATRALLAAGADVEAADGSARTALWYAATNGRVDHARLLLRAGALSNVADDKGVTALGAAASVGAVDVVELLLASPYRQRAFSDELAPALARALHAMHPRVVDVLLEHGATLPATAGKTLVAAAGRAELAMVELLVRRGVDVDSKKANGRTATHEASAYGRSVVLRLLIALGANLNALDADGRTPLMTAVANGRAAIARLLLGAGASPDAVHQRATVRDMALNDGRPEFLAAFSQPGLTIDARFAARIGALDTVKALVAADPEALNRRGADGLAPIHHAALGDQQAVINWLFAQGVRVDSPSGAAPEHPLAKGRPAGLQPIHLAARQGHGATIKLLLAAGADPDAVDANGNSVAWWLAFADNGRRILNDLPEAAKRQTTRVPAYRRGQSAADFIEALAMSTAGGIQTSVRSVERDVQQPPSESFDDDYLAPERELRRDATHCMKARDYLAARHAALDVLAVHRAYQARDEVPKAYAEHTVGRADFYLRRYQQARARYAAATKLLGEPLAEPVWGRDRIVKLAEAIVVDHQGDVDAAMGDLEDAEATYLRALAMRQEFDDTSTTEVAWSYARLGNLYVRLGRYRDAEEMLRRALEVRERYLGLNHALTAATTNDLAVLLDNLGDHEAAEQLYRKHREVLRDSPPEDPAVTAIACFNVSAAKARQSPAEAIAGLEDARARLAAAYPQGHEASGPMALGLASAARRAGEHKLARTALDQAFVHLTQTYGSHHPEVAAAWLERADQAYDGGDEPAREDAVKQALTIALEFDRPELRWRALYAWAQVLHQRGQSVRAVAVGKLAVDVLQSLRGEAGRVSSAAETRYVASREQVYRWLAARLIDEGRLPEASAVVDLLRSEEVDAWARRGAARETDKLPKTAAEQSVAETFIADVDSLVKTSRAYRRLIERKRSGERLSDTEQATLKRLRKQLKAGRVAFDEAVSALLREGSGDDDNAELGARQLDRLRAIQGTLRELGPGAVMLHFVQVSGALHILLTTPDTQVSRTVPLARKVLRQRIATFREQLQDPTSDPVPMAKRLYRSLIEPVAGDLEAADAKTLVVSLDGSLRYIPLAALHNGDGYLVDAYQIVRYTEVAKDKLKDLPADKPRVAAMGASAAVDGFVALPAVPNELELIVQRDDKDEGLLPGTIALDASFDEDALTDAFEGGAPMIHIATHFVFRPGTERDSFLLLGNGAKKSLADIRYDGHSLADVEMLTLSACETAVAGQGRELEGFAAMAIDLGAKSVVATLWRVADESTSLFMAELYRARLEGKPKADALATAQRRLRRLSPADIATATHRDRGFRPPGVDDPVKAVAERNFSHPYFWAPFVLVGNWR